MRGWFSHRTDRPITGIGDADPAAIHRTVTFPDFDIEAFFKGFPQVGRAGCRMDNFYGVIPIVGLLRLFHQNRDHGTDGIELGGAVVPDAVRTTVGAGGGHLAGVAAVVTDQSGFAGLNKG